MFESLTRAVLNIANTRQVFRVDIVKRSDVSLAKFNVDMRMFDDLSLSRVVFDADGGDGLLNAVLDAESFLQNQFGGPGYPTLDIPKVREECTMLYSRLLEIQRLSLSPRVTKVTARMSSLDDGNWQLFATIGDNLYEGAATLPLDKGLISIQESLEGRFGFCDCCGNPSYRQNTRMIG